MWTRTPSANWVEYIWYQRCQHNVNIVNMHYRSGWQRGANRRTNDIKTESPTIACGTDTFVLVNIWARQQRLARAHTGTGSDWKKSFASAETAFVIIFMLCRLCSVRPFFLSPLVSFVRRRIHMCSSSSDTILVPSVDVIKFYCDFCCCWYGCVSCCLHETHLNVSHRERERALPSCKCCNGIAYRAWKPWTNFVAATDRNNIVFRNFPWGCWLQIVLNTHTHVRTQ